MGEIMVRWNRREITFWCGLPRAVLSGIGRSLLVVDSIRRLAGAAPLLLFGLRRLLFHALSARLALASLHLKVAVGTREDVDLAHDGLYGHHQEAVHARLHGSLLLSFHSPWRTPCAS